MYDTTVSNNFKLFLKKDFIQSLNNIFDCFLAVMYNIFYVHISLQC